MAKIKNTTVYSTDHEYLKRLADELDFIGREYVLNLAFNSLTQLALPRVHKKSRKHGKSAARNKKAESAARRS